jgi:hypothetical protein
MGKWDAHHQSIKGLIISKPTRPLPAIRRLPSLQDLWPFLRSYREDSAGCVKAVFSNMKEIIPEPWMWRHRSALLAALLAPLRDVAAWLVIIGLLLQGVLLNCAAFTRIPVYRHTLRHIKKVVA